MIFAPEKDKSCFKNAEILIFGGGPSVQKRLTPKCVCNTRDFVLLWGPQTIEKQKKKDLPPKMQNTSDWPPKPLLQLRGFCFCGPRTVEREKGLPPPKNLQHKAFCLGGGRQVVFNSGRGVGSKVSEIPPAKK